MIKRSGLRKAAHFEKVYPYLLESNEWIIKWPMVIKRKRTTYNPDYFCPTTGYFIEVTTSRQNISDQRAKWSKAIELGHKLKVFWWEGREITEQFA